LDASAVSSKTEVSREEFQELAAEVRDLARRISALEYGAGASQTPESAPAAELEISSDLVPAIGKALLAIAGAYLLRALTDLKILPPVAGVTAGILYAGAWLWLAARSARKITGLAYALASMLILAPLLWEAVGRLRAIPDWVAACVIALFAIAPAWKRNIAAVTGPFCALTALVFLIALHDLVPFTLAVLAIAAAAELSLAAWRWVAALSADCAVIICIVILAKGLPEGYAPASLGAVVAAQVLLLLIYPGTILPRQRALTIYEIGQTCCAFLLAAGGALYLTHATKPIAAALLVGAAACYAMTFFRNAPMRNRYTFALFALLLSLAGAYLITSGVILTAFWCALAVGASFARLSSFQAPVYLWSAALVSSVAEQSKARIWDGITTPFTIDAVLILAAALAAYYVLARSDRIWPGLASAAGWILIAAALTASFLSGALVLTLFALCLAWIGVRAARRELIWLTHGLMVAAASKILIHDFTLGTMPLVGSLLAYGIALILLPRILQQRKTHKA